ncbi:MAG: radical SAM protein, partial [Elusimicrobiota bacterium]
ACKRETAAGHEGRAATAFQKLQTMFDVLVAGDGEESILLAVKDDAPKLIDADDPASPLFLTSARLTELPFPARHLVDVGSYRYQIEGLPAISLIAQLGCPFECGFCGGRQSPMLRRIRMRTTENIVAEIEMLHRAYGVRGFMLYDDELNVNTRMIELMRAIRALQDRLGVEFRLRGFVKSELFNDEQAEAMRQAGFRWILTGFESGSPRILKNINKKATREENTRCVEIAHKHGLKVKALMSIGHPGESEQTIAETRDWLLSAKPEDFDVTIITTYPGTPYYDRAVPVPGKPGLWSYTYEKTGDRLFSQEVDYTEVADYYKGSPDGGYKSFVYTDHLSAEKIVELRDQTERDVRRILGIPFNPCRVAHRYEHSMGQTELSAEVLRVSRPGRNYRIRFVALLLVVVALWLGRSRQVRVTPPPARPEPSPLSRLAKTPPPRPAPQPPAAPPAAPIASPPVADIPATAPEPKTELHQNLIPKDISIIRSYYSQEILAPGSSFGLDINGSGFTSEFGRMITIDPGGADMAVKDLRLVTANQINASIEVGTDAKTAFYYPQVMIKGLPVFRATQPFGVVRRGEVLAIRQLSVAEDSRSMRFSVITNLTENMVKQFWVAPTKPDLEISSLEPKLPFAVEGTLRIGKASESGASGLIVFLFSREIYRSRDMVNLALPNLGKAGLTRGISAVDAFHRPGDTISLWVRGAGFTPSDAGLLTGRIDGLDAGPASFVYASPTEISFSFILPATAPEGSYGVTVNDAAGKVLARAQDALTIVAPLWLRGVEVSPKALAGRTAVLHVSGRDFTPEFARGFQAASEEPGIRISRFTLADPSTLSAEITIGPSVAAGDYWLTFSSLGKPVQPQFPGLIKISAP